MHATAARNLCRSVIEVERKFACDVELVARLRANRGEPAFSKLAYRGRRSFEDVYYDREKRLSARGIWVRKRSGNWQAKVRQAGSYANSQFEELSKPDEIANMLHRVNLELRPAEENFSLLEIARFTTFREEWVVNDRFAVVVDTTDFGHSVGEVELEQTIEVDGMHEDSAAQRRAAAAEMDKEIEAFMKRYPWAFSSSVPVGKLSAYFARKHSGLP